MGEINSNLKYGYVYFLFLFRFVVKDSLLEIVQSVNPGQPPIPGWVQEGAIIGVQGGTETMLEILSEADEYGVAVSGMWIQDWSGKIVTGLGTRVFWNWRWNETWYPDLDNVIQVRWDLPNKAFFVHFHFSRLGNQRPLDRIWTTET